MVNIKNSILKKVENPARYVGGEFNQIIKNKYMVDARVALCYPDLYEKGMSNLELRKIYFNLNNRHDIWCERVFAPWPDYEIELRKATLPLYSLESKEELTNFDILYFYIKDELNYTNILNMINLAGIPVRSKDRNETSPLIIFSGPCMCNPAPLSQFADIFVIGDNITLVEELVDKYIIYKESDEKKESYLEQIKEMEGVYIPSIHISEEQIKYSKMKTIDNSYLSKFIVPSTEIVNDRILVKLSNGTNNKCRINQNSYFNKDYIENNINELVEKIKNCIKDTGIYDVDLYADDIDDFTELNPLLLKLIEIDKKVNLKLDGVDVEKINSSLLKDITELRKNGVIFNVIAGTDRLRKVINLNFTEEQLLKKIKFVFLNCFTYIKLNFVIGLPTENDKDINGIVEFLDKVINIYNEIPKEKKKNKYNIVVNVATFVPMSHTAFQWCGLEQIKELEKKQNKLKESFTSKNISANFDNVKASTIKTVLARGDEKIADAIFYAWRNGARFDNSSECFNFECYKKAFERTNVDYISYANIEYDLNKKLPWDNIIIDTTKDNLKQEYKKAKGIK